MTGLVYKKEYQKMNTKYGNSVVRLLLCFGMSPVILQSNCKRNEQWLVALFWLTDHRILEQVASSSVSFLCMFIHSSCILLKPVLCTGALAPHE